MKKVYTKPMLAIEKFELSQTIAQSCGVNSAASTLGKPTQASKSSCGWDLNGAILWIDSKTNCSDLDPVGPDEEVEGLCYNNPNGGITIFAS